MKKKSMLIVAILLMSIGFAAISATLIINGTAKVSENNEDFSVIFTAASIDGNDVYSTVVDATKKTITFATSELKTLNQTSILTYEVTNNSSNYDANVTVTCVPKDGTTAKYTSIKNKLENDATKVLAKTSLNGTLTVTLNKTSTEEVTEEYTCKLEFNAVERDTLGVELTQFQKDDWSTIAANVKTGNTDKYNVGDTKSVDLGTFGIHTVRIANKSECESETSETACGFVVEFADIITKQKFNSTNTNKGGWKDSELRTYINNTIYKSLPSDLQNVITTTKVISGHGSTSRETNFETQDKLYLLSSEEIYEGFASSSNAQYDTSIGTSKQLDYYKSQGVTTDNYAGAIKQYNGRNDYWWLRSASSTDLVRFIRVLSGGEWNYYTAAGDSFGATPAFRLQGPTAFQKDNWPTIASNVKSGNTDKYNVGDTKEVDLGSFGTHIVRIANKSECTNGETSETACGFVVEFADVITEQQFNSTGTNKGGWKDSKMRTYINDTIYKSLPSDLQNVITTTKVISGHGSTSGETNFETQDKLYLLTSEEIYEDFASSTTYADKETAYGTSKQLDYYKNQGVTTTNYAGAIKQYNGSDHYWWLRSAMAYYPTMFLRVRYNGCPDFLYPTSSDGISPAFRLQGPTAFQKDDWSTIAANVKTGNTDKYNVGDTKEVDLGTLGTHTVRIANKSECTTETSKTACGFVVEFADVITEQTFNSTNTNVGGWRDSEIRTYINDTIYKSLPSDLQSVIATTKVISGHGNTSGEKNFETQDKLYLLSAHEVYEADTDGYVSSDTSYNNTKQLDYYKNQGVTTDNYAGTIKQCNGSNSDWWLRSATPSSPEIFTKIHYNGYWSNSYAYSYCGISPAFRIA